MMEGFILSGLAIDFILLVLIVELLVLWFLRWKFLDALVLLLPAGLILYALKAALLEAHWLFVAVPLTLAFPVHLADLKRRKRNMKQP